MNGRVPVHLWTWPKIAAHMGVGVRTVKAWKQRGAPIRRTEKGIYAEGWTLTDWWLEQPDYVQANEHAA